MANHQNETELIVIKMKNSNGNEIQYQVQLKVVKMSATLKDMHELADKNDNSGVYLHEVEAEVFEKILKWADYHVDDQDENEDDIPLEARTSEISKWDKDFLEKLDRSLLYKLIKAANYLHLQKLIESCGKLICGWMKGKSVEEVREMLGIKNDFSPEEEARLKEENAWAEGSN